MGLYCLASLSLSPVLLHVCVSLRVWLRTGAQLTECVCIKAKLVRVNPSKAVGHKVVECLIRNGSSCPILCERLLIDHATTTPSNSNLHLALCCFCLFVVARAPLSFFGQCRKMAMVSYKWATTHKANSKTQSQTDTRNSQAHRHRHTQTQTHRHTKAQTHRHTHTQLTHTHTHIRDESLPRKEEKKTR